MSTTPAGEAAGEAELDAEIVEADEAAAAAEESLLVVAEDLALLEELGLLLLL